MCKVGKAAVRKRQATKSPVKRKAVAHSSSSGSDSSSSSSDTSTSSGSSSSSTSSESDSDTSSIAVVPEPEPVFHDCIEYSPPTEADLEEIGAPSAPAVEAAVAAAVTRDVGMQSWPYDNEDKDTQTRYTTYPVCLDNAGTIIRQIGNLQAVFASCMERIRSSRNHMEVKKELEYLTEQMRSFLNFHRVKITEYTTAVVEEGYRAGVKNVLREQSNGIIMPIMSELDSLRRTNLELGARGSTFDAMPYRRRMDTLRDLQASLRELKNLKPVQHLI